MIHKNMQLFLRTDIGRLQNKHVFIPFYYLANSQTNHQGGGTRPRVSSLVLDWLQSLEQLFINVSYHILVASLTLMALF